MIRGATLCALGIAFLGGLGGGGAVGVGCVALGAFIQACAAPRAPWQAAVLVISAWAAGTGVAALLTFIAHPRGLESSGQLDAGLTVLAGYASAAAGAALAWITSRFAHQN